MKLTKEEEIWLKKHQSFFTNHYQNNRNGTTHFLTPKEQMILQSHLKTYDLQFDGGYAQAERKQAHFIAYPNTKKTYVIFQLRYNTRFHEVTHRDVLGSVLSLGVERDQIGDIIVFDGIVQLIVTRTIAPFLKQNFTMIKRASFELKEIESVSEKEVSFETLECVVASYRLDVFVAALTNVSRKIAGEFIEKGYVQVNHQVLHSGNYQCEPLDLLSIRKYGRFIFKEQLAQSKKGRYRVLCLKQQ